MKPKCSDLSKHLPIRARVAFALAVAERVLPAVKNAHAVMAARRALDDCWSWEEGKTIRAAQLYEKDDEALVLQGSLANNQQASAAISTVTSAFYYTLWQAFKQDLKKGFVRAGEIPMMTEITEEVLDELCESATQTSFCDVGCITSIIDRLLQDSNHDTPNELGPTISREHFTI